MKKALIIFVSYNSFNHSKNYLKSIIKLKNFKNTDVIVVENSDSNNSLAQMKKFVTNLSLENVKVIEMDTNLGYFPGIAFALNSISEIHKYDFTIISNNDIIIKDKKILEKIFRKTLKCDVIAPSILTKDKIDQNPFLLNKYNIKNKIFHFIYFSSFSIANLVTFVKKIIDRILPNSNKKIKSDTYIYAAHGSFIVLCKSFFSKGGYVDNNFFLYAEESTLAEIAKKINAKILYSPDIVVNHEARGPKIKKLSKKKFLIQKKSHNYFKKNYQNVND